MNTFRRLSQISPTFSNLPIQNDGDLNALPMFPERQMDFFKTPETNEGLLNSPGSAASLTSMRQAGKRSAYSRRCSLVIFRPLVLIFSCLLLPSSVLLALTIYYRVASGKSIFADPEETTKKQALYVNVSATILTNISSVSSTLAPFLVGMIMGVWNAYVARALIKSSQEDSETSQPLPTPEGFSLLANMRAGRGDQIWKYLSFRRKKSQTSPLVLRQTVIILFISFVITFLTFLGDQFFHIWSESVILNRYTVPDNYSSFGRGLTPACIHFNRIANYGWPCTLSNFISPQEYAEREQELTLITSNTSKLNEIEFLKAADLSNGDLAVLYPATGAIPSNYDYHATTLGVSTQCQFMTPLCKIKHLSLILTQFNCTDTFFGVLGKPANITSDVNSKPQDPDVPGLAWKISAGLEYAFYADRKLQVPYNPMGLNPKTGNNDPDLPFWPDSKLVNPVFLSVAGRISKYNFFIDSTLGGKSSNQLLQPTNDNVLFDFMLNCSYTTYDVEYSMVNGTILPDFKFTPTPNGSVAEEWHGRQEYTSFTGDPSNGLDDSNILASRQLTPDEFARTWANLYSARVLAVIGAYTNLRVNIQEQAAEQMLVTRVVPWTLGFLLAANFMYLLLGMVVGMLAWTVSSKEVLQVSKNMDLNEQIAGRYGGEEMSKFEGKGRGEVSGMDAMQGREAGDGLRVGVVEDRFASIYYAT